MWAMIAGVGEGFGVQGNYLGYLNILAKLKGYLI